MNPIFVFIIKHDDFLLFDFNSGHIDMNRITCENFFFLVFVLLVFFIR